MSMIKDSILGFVVGDAMGVPIEFVSRDELLKKPVTSMLGNGTYNVPAGTWSDDTSLTLATIDSIIKFKEISYNDMAKKFCDWALKGEYTATGEVLILELQLKKL